MGKFTIRQDIRKLHRNLTEEIRCNASESIFAQIESMEEFQRARYVAIYYALADEVPTAWVIERWSEMGKIILLPRVDGELMEFYPAKESELTRGAFGIIEPQGSEIIAPDKIELMIVPAVALCKDGSRVGRGRGYYDKYLSRCKKSLYKIGVCFNYQLLNHLPCDSHDVKMNRVVVDF